MPSCEIGSAAYTSTRTGVAVRPNPASSSVSTSVSRRVVSSSCRRGRVRSGAKRGSRNCPIRLATTRTGPCLPPRKQDPVRALLDPAAPYRVGHSLSAVAKVQSAGDLLYHVLDRAFGVAQL